MLTKGCHSCYQRSPIFGQGVTSAPSACLSVQTYCVGRHVKWGEGICSTLGEGVPDRGHTIRAPLVARDPGSIQSRFTIHLAKQLLGCFFPMMYDKNI